MIESAARPSLSPREARLAAWLRTNAHGVLVSAIYAAGVSVALSQEFVQDTWLSLAGGRDVARHGLPWHERLTALTHGTQWVDQQWLGKLILYAVASLGGLRALALVHVALLAGALACAVAVARKHGASDQAVFWVAAATIPAAPWAWQLRVQSLSYILYVVVLALLVADAERPSRRVWFVLPTLALWANIHGSVTLGVGVTVLAGVAAAAQRRIRGLLLMFGGVACLFASPYTLSLVSYYRSLLFNPLMRDFVDEWRPSSAPSALPFFVLVVAVAFLIGRNRKRVNAFELLALALTAVGGFMAIRGIVWFLLTAVVVVPRSLDAELRRRSATRLIAGLAVAATAVAIVIAAVSLHRLPGRIAVGYPPAAARAAASALAGRPGAKVFASERFTDWLLWEKPQLAGRLVYDVRFELFDRTQFTALSDFHSRVGDWRRILDGASVVVLDRARDSAPAGAIASEHGARTLYADHDVTVIARSPRSAQ